MTNDFMDMLTDLLTPKRNIAEDTTRALSYLAHVDINELRNLASRHRPGPGMTPAQEAAVVQMLTDQANTVDTIKTIVKQLASRQKTMFDAVKLTPAILDESRILHRKPEPKLAYPRMSDVVKRERNRECTCPWVYTLANGQRLQSHDVDPTFEKDYDDQR